MGSTNWLGGVCQAFPDPADPWSAYQANAAPFFAKYCQDCHTQDDPDAEIKFDIIRDAAALKSHQVELEKTVRMLGFKLMPPKDQPQPSDEDRAAVLNWLRGYLRNANLSLPRSPGRVTTRRLNRTEYNNTIQDLLGIDIDTTPTFPEDNSGYGFDNNGDVLSIAPVLLEKYLAAADLVLERALFVQPAVPPAVTRYDATKLEGTVPLSSGEAVVVEPPGGGRRGRRQDPAREYPYNGELYIDFDFPKDGTYLVRVRGYKVGSRAQVNVLVDGEVMGEGFAVAEDKGRPSYASSEPFRVTAGKRRVAVALVNGLTREALEASQAAERAAAEAAEAAALAQKLLDEAGGKPAAADENANADAPQNPPAAIDAAPAADGQPAAGRRGGRGARGAAGRRGGGGRGRGPRQVVLGLEFIEIEGPLERTLEQMPESYQHVVAVMPFAMVSDRDAAEASIRKFASRAFRRPALDAEVTRLLELWDVAHADGDSFGESLHFALQAVLASPCFLFRVEGEPADADDVYDLNEYELASRLSYFLWSSMPDQELFDEARQGTLRDHLAQQLARMLASPKSDALVTNFAVQWLQLKGLYGYSPNLSVFPDWDEPLRQAMIRETELCFAEVLRSRRSFLEFLDSDYTFLNERLARHYGINGVTGDEFRKVSLTDDRRGGLLAQASFLTLTSYPDRTSPVRRGKWVLETLLGTPPPDPPPGIPALAEQPLLVGTLREKLEQHRENPNCAACHALMDPIGFGLENFNAIGQWREKDGEDPIEPSGVLPTGEAFDGPGQLRTALLREKEQLTRCLTEQMLTYSLGRGLERSDQVFIEEISASVAQSGYRLDVLIAEIVKSDPFQKRSAKRGVE